MLHSKFSPILFVFLLLAGTLFLSACSEAPLTEATGLEGSADEKAAILADLEAANEAGKTMVPITYNPELFPNSFVMGQGVQGTSPFRNISNSATWQYYFFCATAGDVPTIEVHRTTNAMDPAMSLYFGTTNDNTGVSRFSGGPNMTFVAAADDNNGIPHGVGGRFSDPELSGLALPSTGFYTLAVYDFIGLGPGPLVPFEIHLDGFGCANVDIDIKPSSDPNSINPSSMGVVPVAFLTTSLADGDAVDFDATTVDPTTVRFGPARASPVHDLTDAADRAMHQQDVDGDGDTDFVFHFTTKETGIAEGDTQACMFGRTSSGDAVLGCDDIRVLEKPAKPKRKIRGPLTSVTFFLNHADCQGNTGSWSFFLNDAALGSAGTTVGCVCNSQEQVVTFDDPNLLSVWNPQGGNVLRVDVNSTPTFGVAIGYIRAELETRSSDGTFAVFDATGGDASNRDLCDGFLWNHQQSSFTVTVP